MDTPSTTTHGSLEPARLLTVWLGLGWMVIGVKCVLVTFAIEHWHLPVHPLWVIGPTLFLAAFATFLYVSHRDE